MSLLRRYCLLWVFAAMTSLAGKASIAAPVVDIAALSVNSYHSCLVLRDGTPKCWGANHAGALGDGSTTVLLIPTAVAGLGGSVKAVASGGFHSCAMMSAGGVKCWGFNDSGEVGDGTTIRRLYPVDVTGLNVGVRSIAAGRHHACAIISNGGLKCWGYNGEGQLGDGSLTSRAVPVDTTSLGFEVRAMALGDRHTCALGTNGQVKCWGDNASGQLGSAPSGLQPNPLLVSGLRGNIVGLSAGRAHTCALADSGAVMCWGENGEGQLGNGGTVSSSSPVSVTGLDSAVELSLGQDHSCARLASGGVKCWGQNANGQLGDGSNSRRILPIDVIELNGPVRTLSVGYLYSCALLQDGTAQCWGGNASGELGNGMTTSSTVPVTVVDGLPPALVGSGATTLAPPLVPQSRYVLADGRIPEAAVQVNATGTLGSASVEVSLDISRIMSVASSGDGVFAAGYNAYVVALVPGRQIQTVSDAWLVNARQRGWEALSMPLSAFLENVAVSGMDQKIIINIVRDTDLSKLIGTEFYVGYGTSGDEMLAAKRYRGVYKVVLQ